MKGICFKEPLFHKVVAGEKTQTRRIVVLKTPWAKEITESATPKLIEIRFKPKYQPGEIIFLKEPYFAFPDNSGLLPVYRYQDPVPDFHIGTWKNKLFMPEKFARYFIQITNVTAERAWDITEEDAIAEGCKNRAEFEGLWMQIHGISSWKGNPWVWKYTFTNTYEL